MMSGILFAVFIGTSFKNCPFKSLPVFLLLLLGL